MYELKKIDISSYAKMKAALCGAIMFIFGALWVIMGLLALIINSAFGTSPYIGTGIGYSPAAGLIIMVVGVVLGAVCGYICGAILALVYNFVASKIGGVKLDLEQLVAKNINNSKKNNTR